MLQRAEYLKELTHQMGVDLLNGIDYERKHYAIVFLILETKKKGFSLKVKTAHPTMLADR